MARDDKSREKGGEKAQNSAQIAELFRQHLKEHHSIDSDAEFSEKEIKQHLQGAETLLPATIFSKSRLSPLGTIVKYLKEEEQLSNAQIARLLRRSGTNVWLTYRNAHKKMPGRLAVDDTNVSVPSSAFDRGLSVLESVAYHLHDIEGLSFADIGKILRRDERTVWTVVHMAKKKLVRAG